MRLSIWQQFSSNHSSYFWIAGTFKTDAETDAARSELRDVLLAIDQWRRDHPEEFAKADGLSPLPIEVELAKKYDVSWPEGLDWLADARYTSRDDVSYGVEGLLQVVGRTIIIWVGGIWSSVDPIEGILRRLGADTASYDLLRHEAGLVHDVRLDVTCVAPDEATAANIEQAVRAYLSHPLASDDNPPPWHNDAENFEKAYLKSDLLRREHVERLNRSWERYFSLDHNDFYRNRLRLKRLTLERGTFRRDGLLLTFEDIWFDELPFALALSVLLAWLIVHDCAAITPRFSVVERIRG